MTIACLPCSSASAGRWRAIVQICSCWTVLILYKHFALFHEFPCSVCFYQNHSWSESQLSVWWEKLQWRKLTLIHGPLEIILVLETNFWVCNETIREISQHWQSTGRSALALYKAAWNTDSHEIMYRRENPKEKPLSRKQFFLTSEGTLFLKKSYIGICQAKSSSVNKNSLKSQCPTILLEDMERAFIQ